MKTKPSLFLTSLCVLLCQATTVDAQQQPQPRFGYGSVPRGSYVIPAPKTAPKPVVSTKPKPAAKPTVAKAKTTAKPVAKPTPKPAPKTAVAKATPKKPAAKPAPEKVVASTKSKTKSKPAPEPKPAPKTQVAKSTTRPSSKVQAKPEPTRVREREPQIAATRPVKSTPSAPGTKSSSVAKSSPARTTPGVSDNPLADVSTTAPKSAGIHFFGQAIHLPGLPSETTTQSTAARPSQAPDRNAFVDVLAARHSLTHSRLDNKRAEAADAAPALPAAASKTPAPNTNPSPEPPAAPTVASLDPDTLETPVLPEADALPATHPDTISLDEPAAARSVPASLQLSTALPEKLDSTLENTTLDEPALPSPVIARVTPDTVKEETLTLDSEPPLPTENPPPSAIVATEEPESEPEPEPAVVKPAKSGKTSALAAAASALTDDQDLSERERAFVRSLAEAAGTVTTASGQMNKELPRSIATAATALMDQVPAETVNTFRAAAGAAKESVQDTVNDLVPDLPMEMSNELMPATPEKMPDRLPTFNAASSGKIDVQSDRQADYDQANNKVIFTGKVELNSAAIRLRAERVEVFMKKGGGGMERVEATGNVLMRTQDTASGPGQMASAGRASYNLKTGEITLADWPKIQEAGKSHISTDPSTKMFMFTDGRLRTDGPNRTLIGGE